MTEFAGLIGLDTTQHAFYDVFGLDEVRAGVTGWLRAWRVNGETAAFAAARLVQPPNSLLLLPRPRPPGAAGHGAAARRVGAAAVPDHS